MKYLELLRCEITELFNLEMERLDKNIKLLSEIDKKIEIYRKMRNKINYYNK